MWTCSFIPLTTNAFSPNHFIVLHNKLKSPVVDLTFVFADDNHDDDSASATAAVACVGNDDEDDDTAAFADISDNGTVYYDEDEAHDYDDDAVDKDGHFVSTEPDILPGGKSLPLDLTFVFADENHDDDSASAIAAVACVGNDDEDDDTAAVADISDNADTMPNIKVGQDMKRGYLSCTAKNFQHLLFMNLRAVAQS
ncbi:hypothetical protein PoB_001164200 [Plakobranchus ocellatus]|uniref:Uncharacterized protein n=1 Tax=Plakobranchus ocellatus TaxID=259542 RepID=A0AAV3YRL9_9GAST|nr:hypothetical protein PoB_001164200 [Plakobranchus ocellatus]